MRSRYALGGYLAGAVTARTGDEMSGPALLLAAFAVTGSSSQASLLLAGSTVAAAVGGPVLGALLDRAARPGRLLGCALALYGTGLLLVLAGLGRLPLPAVVLIAVAAGLLGPALSGGWTAQLPRVAPGTALPRANALDAMTFGTAALAGPALAGLTAEALNAPTAVVVSATLIALAAPVAWGLPAAGGGAGWLSGVRGGAEGGRGWGWGRGRGSGRGQGWGRGQGRGRGQGWGQGRDRGQAPGVTGGPPLWRSRPARPGSRPPARAQLAADLVAGARCVLRTPALARATVASVVCCAAQGMLTACVPLLGERAFGGAGQGAFLLACTALSALAANAVLARAPLALAPDTLVRAAALVQALALALAATGHPALLITAALLIGVGEGPQLTALFAIRYREAPERLRGQVFTTGASLKLTGFALGAAVAGATAEWSLPGTLLLAAAVALLGAPAYSRPGGTGEAMNARCDSA
ncbi:MFS transporter [Streptomyces sp. NPDC004610]|uniref:MFS transporter n=1 Tax=unclassified Streptomyces TaxID=2593676 RepID=UPI0033A9476D